MFFQSTGATAQQLLYLTSTGDLVSAPDSTSGVDQKFLVLDRKTNNYRGVVIYPASVSGTSTGPRIQTFETSTGAGTTIYYNSVLYGDLVTNSASYLQLTGSSSGGLPNTAIPTVQALGADADVYLSLSPKGAGLINFNVGGAALGGGAGATLGTIGGNGPGVAAQYQWLPISIGSSTGRFFLPVWST